MSEREAQIRCSRLKTAFLPAGTEGPTLVELEAVYAELEAIERRAGDPHVALDRMTRHLSRRVMPSLDRLRAANGLKVGYAEQVLGKHLEGN